MRLPTFSICHATARPQHWQQSYNAWWANCDDPESVEYILAVDERWGFNPQAPPQVNSQTRILWCTGKRNSLTAWNQAAAVAQGHVLLMNADDFLPPPHWDTEFLKVLPFDLGRAEFVIQTSSGCREADQAGLMVFYALSRRRYERLGYVLNPQYEGLFVDNEFGDHARLDGVVIDARHLVVEHRHPYYHNELFPWDEVYQSGNTKEACERGRELYRRRKREGFPPVCL